MPLKEIACREGISLGTVKSRISRAKDKIRSMLCEYLRGDKP
jgi:DNA-directed RNA polymerase specialized sigma24 family protein